MIGVVLAATVALASVPAGSTPTEGDGGIPLPDADTGQILEVSVTEISIGDRQLVTTYRNSAYRCGRDGDFPFVVVEGVDAGGDARPLWVLLHGGGTGYYDDEGHYVAIGGNESANDAESTGELLRLLYDYAGVDGTTDTFVADRLAAGDRFAIGSLCDHDLYLGVGQPYPHDPHHDDTVDGLLANLAMVDAVVNGTATVAARPTTSLWVLGTSAGAFGGYALAHNLSARGVDVTGVVLDSGLLTAPALTAPGHEWVVDAGMVAKHGPYLADTTLWIDHAVAADGFDVALFDTVEEGDASCRGEGPGDGCVVVHSALADAIADHGDAAMQQVHIYPGSAHIATTKPATPVQADLRAWYAAVIAHRR